MKKQLFLFSVMTLVSLEVLGSALRRRPVTASEAAAAAAGGEIAERRTNTGGDMSRQVAPVSGVATKAQAEQAAAANPAGAAAAAIEAATSIAGSAQPDKTVMSYLTGKPVQAGSNNKANKLGRLK